MKRRKHSVDDFFKEALHGHRIQPSDAGKHRFLREASTLKSKGQHSVAKRFLVIACLVIISLGILLLWLARSEKDQGTRKPSGSESTQHALRSSHFTVPDVQTANNTPKAHSAYSSIKLSDDFSSSHVTSRLTSSGSPTSLPVAESLSKDAPREPTEPLLRLSSYPIVFQLFPEPKNVYGLVPEKEPSDPEDHLRTGETGLKSRQATRVMSSFSRAVSLSGYYYPEWMFNTLEGDQSVTSFGLEIGFRFGRYSVRTGVGLSYTKGTNELVVEYNDYLGSFRRLDSIQFNWDDKRYHLIPTYFFSNQDVWDSLSQWDYPRLIKRYTYWQIPLILGYDVFQNKWVRFGFRGGPTLSILMSSRQLTEVYDPGKNRIIRINQITPDRIQANWQVQGGINVSFQVSRHITWELEPTIKYYFHSVYEKSDITKKPWSAGFRTAVTVLL